jgi:hypothetical protein
MCFFRLRPEPGNREAIVEVRAKVIHDGDRKHDIPNRTTRTISISCDSVRTAVANAHRPN